MSEWEKTDVAGVKKSTETEGRYKILATALDPETGKRVYRRRTLNNSTMLDAVQKREALKRKIQTPKTTKKSSIPTSSIAFFAREWANRMVATGRWGKGTAKTNRKILAQHILPEIGHLDVDGLTRERIRRWIAQQESARYDKARSPDRTEMVPYADDTLKRHWAVMRHLVTALYLEGHVDRRFVDWCQEIRGPRAPDVEPRREDKTLTLEELRAFVEASKTIVPTRHAEIVTLAWTGLRGGELYGLDWGHLDFESGEIKVVQSFSKKAGLKAPKTRRPGDVVPMIPPVAKAIQRHRRDLFRKGNLGAIDGIVFPANNGNRRYAETLHKPMQKVADELGVDVRMGSQIMRKTLITLLNNHGTTRSLVKGLAGHESDKTNDGYTVPRSEDLAAPIVELHGG